MSRRRKNQNLARQIKKDPVYQDEIVGRFINKIMWEGKKEKARKIVYDAFKEIESHSGVGESGPDKALNVFKKAIENCKPSLEVRSRRVGGATYQVPVDVRPARRLSLAMNWIILNSRGRKGKTISKCLSEELVDAYNNRGGAVKKREDVHRMAESNRAFSHYNW